MYPMYLRYGDFVAEIKTKARIYHRRALPKNPAVVRVATLPEVPISYLRIRVGLLVISPQKVLVKMAGIPDR